MLFLSRTLGEKVLIEDVCLTVVRIGSAYAEVSLKKVAGGKSLVVTLPHNEYVNICYDVKVVFVGSNGSKMRLGIEAPPEIRPTRAEFEV